MVDRLWFLAFIAAVIFSISATAQLNPQSPQPSTSRSAPGSLMDVRLFGAKCDWNGRTGSDDTRAFTLALKETRNLYIPPGAACLLQDTPTPAKGSFRLSGVPGQSTLVIDHRRGPGLQLRPQSLMDQIVIEGIDLRCAATNGPCPLGIDIEYPSAPSFPYRTAVLRNLRFVGDLGVSSAPWPRTWGRALRLANAWNALVEGNTGISTFVHDDESDSGFLELAGGPYGSVALRMNRNTWYYGSDFVRMAAYTEGLISSDNEAVGVTRGYYAPPGTPRGGFARQLRGQAVWIYGGSIAAQKAGIELNEVDGLIAQGVDITRQPGSIGDWSGVRLLDSNYARINGGALAGNTGTGQALGIVARGPNSSNAIVSNVHFENLDSQFDLGPETSRWTLTGNSSTGRAADSFRLAGALHVVNWRNAAGDVVSYAGEHEVLRIGAAGVKTSNSFPPPSLPEFANDAAAAHGGVLIGQLYRSGSRLMVRLR